MSSAPRLVLGPGPRLAALGRCLRLPTGAGLLVLADLVEALEQPLAPGAWLVLDPAAVPDDDLGLLRRIRATQRGLRVLWTAQGADLARAAALAAAEDVLRGWPLDVTALVALVERPDDHGSTAVKARTKEAVPKTVLEAAPESGPESDPVRAPATPAGTRHGAPPKGPAPSAPVAPRAASLDPDLAEIEAILAGLARPSARRPTAPPQPSSPAPLPSAPSRADDAFADDDLEPLDESPGDTFGDSFGDTLGDEGDDSRRAVHDEPHDERSGAPSGPRAIRAAALADDPGPLLTAEELDAFFAPEPADSPAIAPPSARPASSAAERATPVDAGQAILPLPRWYREQVADLADLVQSAELAVHAAADGGGLDAARAEVARLRQFARTLGCLASPPTAGRTRVDLGVLVEEHLATLAQRPPGSAPRPRFLFRTEPGVEVLADKGLLAAALDAVLQVAAAAGGPGDVVRAEVLRGDVGVALVRVELPEGRLAGLAPAQLLEPYGLRQRLPEIGANALAAAGGILVGHGGDLDLQRKSGGRLVFGLRLPMAPRG